MLPDEIYVQTGFLAGQMRIITDCYSNPKYGIEGDQDLVSLTTKGFDAVYKQLLQDIRGRLGVDRLTKATFDLFREPLEKRTRRDQ